ncbi:hypothetical protein DPV78_005823 [Talaromyces pinophilus]|nr:hypothetical protein DPV78_005823 [Talaromyces pinophilus]
MASSRFIEILDNTTAQQHQISSSDVKLEDVLADQEATVQQQRSRSSSTQSSSSRKSHEYTNTTTSSNSSGINPRLSMSRDESQSPSSPSSPTSPVPRMRRLRKFTLSGGFGR